MAQETMFKLTLREEPMRQSLLAAIILAAFTLPHVALAQSVGGTSYSASGSSMVMSGGTLETHSYTLAGATGGGFGHASVTINGTISSGSSAVLATHSTEVSGNSSTNIQGTFHTYTSSTVDAGRNGDGTAWSRVGLIIQGVETTAGYIFSWD
jgi:hypothetical protein